jgi:hypothetical protein
MRQCLTGLVVILSLGAGTVSAQEVTTSASGAANASQVAAAAAPSSTPVHHWSLDTAAGGGFVGIKAAGVQTLPNTTCDKSTPPVCTVDPNNIIIVKNNTYAWQPALAVGLIFRYIRHIDPKTQDGIGIGVGGQFVFVPRGDSTRAAPAATLHVGTQSKQLFFGAIFAPADTVDIPGGGNRAVVPLGFSINSLARTDGGRGPTYFAGVVIAGKSITAPEPAKKSDGR